MVEDKLFDLYLKELVEWNKKFNLTAITEPAEIRRKHFEDSLLLLETIKLTNQSLVDIGTGGGFPGIPLKIACPDIKLTLVEATRKKVSFLEHIVKLLNLKDVEIIWGRAEDLAHQRKENFDIAVARAVAPFNLLLEYCLPFVKIGGAFVAYKGITIEPEIFAAKNALKKLGGEIKDVKNFPRRSLVFIQKVSKTPLRYPRSAGIAKKNPL